jgi:glyoxylase-like metal-dependent hydrolase (beta-lactamase superfamily II)
MGLYLKQLLAGRDFAKTDIFASQMANFVYLVGDDVERTCMVVDPAWDIEGILDVIDGDDMKLVGGLVTHYHPDHVGGNIFSHDIAGLAQLQTLRPVKIYVNDRESEGVKEVTGVSDTDLVKMQGGDEISIGKTNLRFLHTPGHTPGSQCFLAGATLISGDTLFIGGCGRVDLPGSDPSQMYYSLTQVLAKLPDETILYPGHDYSSKPVSTIGQEKRDNYYMNIPNLETWQLLMNR